MDVKQLAEETAMNLKGKFEENPDFLRNLVETRVLQKIANDCEQYVTDLLSDQYREGFNALVIETISGWIKRGDLGKITPTRQLKKAFHESLRSIDEGRAEEQFRQRNWQIFAAVESGKKMKEVAVDFGISPARVGQIHRAKEKEFRPTVEMMERCGYRVEKI